ncbi:hypothetical protein ABNF65_19235 [Paenibacillus larvae]
MKITVNNADEQKLIQQFLDALHDHLSEVEDADNKLSSKYSVQPYLGNHEYNLVHENLQEIKVEIDRKEKPLTFDDDDIITGECSICGKHTIGTINEAPLPYAEYVWLTSEESRKDWRCESCFIAREDEHGKQMGINHGK